MREAQNLVRHDKRSPWSKNSPHWSFSSKELSVAQTHAYETAIQSENQAAVSSILTDCGWLLNGMRDDKTLLLLLERLCSHLGLNKFSVDQRWVGLYKLIGRNLLNHGKVRDAVRVLEEVVRIEQQTLTGAYEANVQVKDAVSLEQVAPSGYCVYFSRQLRRLLCLPQKGLRHG